MQLVTHVITIVQVVNILKIYVQLVYLDILWINTLIVFFQIVRMDLIGINKNNFIFFKEYLTKPMLSM